MLAKRLFPFQLFSCIDILIPFYYINDYVEQLMEKFTTLSFTSHSIIVLAT